MSSCSPALQGLVTDAKALFKRHYGSCDKTFVTVAPGRVNLIGEHVDYTGGFVLPLAIDYSTVVYGSGQLVPGSTSVKMRLVSKLSPDTVETAEIDAQTSPPKSNEGKWTLYVVGVVAQYLQDLPANTGMEIKLSVAGNVPIGGGLSSSASLEVAVARFLECIVGAQDAKIRALRCQKAENVWCHSPCGIMDQYVSSAASDGSLLLIDCTSFQYQECQMKQPNTVALVVTDSHVSHDIAGGEYPARVAQCKEATLALQSVHGDQIHTLRDATLEQVEGAKDKMNDVSYRRARHVVTENARTLHAKDALEAGDWTRLGELMNGSHASMKDDYEVSCKEIDILVELAQGFEGVYGSRLTGGGFGGCTVTLVEKTSVKALMEHLAKEYKANVGKECTCFETSPGPGSRLIREDCV